MPNGKTTEVVLWLVSLLVGLAVGFGLIAKTLTIPFLPAIITVITGWIVVILLVVSVFVKFMKK